MKSTILKGIGILLLLILSCDILSAQNSDYVRIGNINDKIILDKYEDFYLLTYEDINMDSKGEMNTLKLKDKDATTKLYEIVKNSFIEENESPTTLNLNDNEIRIYFKKRTLKADYVEIIHEDLNTEVTGTLPWLTLEELEKLFGKKK